MNPTFSEALLKNPISDVPFVEMDHKDLSELATQHIQKATQALEAAEHAASFQESFLKLESCTEPLERLITWVGHLESVATTPELREAYNQIQAPISAFFSSIALRTHLYHTLKNVYSKTDHSKLTSEEKRYAEKTLRDFEKNGAALPENKKKRLTEIDVKLSELTNKFSQNTVDATAAFSLYLEDDVRLGGIPEHAKTLFQNFAQQKNRTEQKKNMGYLITLSGPSVQAVLTFADDRSLRQQIWEATNQKATGAPHHNESLMVDIIKLRNEKAKLLGYNTFADFVLEHRMAKSGAKALAFVNDLRQKAEPSFIKENEALASFAKTQGHTDELKPWDIAYLSEKMRKAEYDFDEELLRPYFVATQVLNACFDVANKLYGITVKERSCVSWHPDVRTFDLFDQERLLGSFYVDLYSRETKRGGAWMNALVTGNPKKNIPHIGLFAMDGTPASASLPSLLNFREVQTVFHEFGHLLHHMLSEVQVRSLAGTNVAWDFVELPSQVMENWAWEDEVLTSLGKHHQTGAPIPQEYISKLKRARNFRSANMMMRQLSFAYTDLMLHTAYDPDRDGDVLTYCKQTLQPFYPLPLPETFKMFASFGHLFGDSVGYAAGYYSYKWAEMLDADAFSLFKKASLFDPELAKRFRFEILAKGDSDDPEQLYVNFAGRSADPNALLERSGLLSSSPL